MNNLCVECGSPYKVSKFRGGKPYCQSHYNEMYFHGKIRKYKNKRKENSFVEKESWTEIHYDNGDVAFVDKEDIPFIEQCYWGHDVHGYLHGRINGKLARLHRHLLGFPNGVIDHINRNKLDNRKENLRVGTQKGNSRNLSIAKNNKTGVTGIYRTTDTKNNKWKAEIMVDRKKINLGRYETLEEAKEVRKKAEIKYFGEYAPAEG